MLIAKAERDGLWLISLSLWTFADEFRLFATACILYLVLNVVAVGFLFFVQRPT
jgi:hypothetical protein